MRTNNQASSTAFTVIQGILYRALQPEYKDLVPQEVVDISTQILASSTEGKKRLNQLKSHWFRKIAPLKERLLIPGITLHYVLRKRCIEEHVVQALAEGITQVISLGAGLDPLLCRLSKKYQGISWIEVDHPSSIALKEQAVNALQDQVNQVNFLPVDLASQDLNKELRSFPQFQTNRPTLFIAEGVFMYLKSTEVRQVLQSLGTAGQDPARIIFTCVEPFTLAKHSYGLLLKVYLKIHGEPLRWVQPKAQISQFLQESQYNLKSIITSSQMQKKWLPPERQNKEQHGEYIVVAEHKG